MARVISTVFLCLVGLASLTAWAQEHTPTSVKAFGHDFPVNTIAVNGQDQPVVARLSERRFVVVWASDQQDASGDNLWGQVFDVPKEGGDGIPLKFGREFLVNTYGLSDQGMPVVTRLTDSRFVIIWASYDARAGMHWGVYGQLFDIDDSTLSTGVRKFSSEFPVSFPAGDAENDQPVICRLTDTRFVVTWRHRGATLAILGNTYEVTTEGPVIVGNKRGLSISTANSLDIAVEDPTITALSSTRFVVVWDTLRPSEVSGTARLERRLQGRVIQMDGNTFNDDRRDVFIGEAQSTVSARLDQLSPAVAAVGTTSFFVTWMSETEGNVWEIYGQLFHTSAADHDSTTFPVAQEPIRITSATSGSAVSPAVTGINDGELMVTWTGEGDQDGSGSGVFGKIISIKAETSNDGGSKFLVNLQATNDQYDAMPTILADTHLVVVWTSRTQGSDGTTVVGRLFSVDSDEGHHAHRGKSSESHMTGVIIGIVVVGIILAVLVVVGVRSRRNRVLNLNSGPVQSTLPSLEMMEMKFLPRDSGAFIVRQAPMALV